MTTNLRVGDRLPNVTVQSHRRLVARYNRPMLQSAPAEADCEGLRSGLGSVLVRN